jgi:hypothetical protein
VSSQEHAAGGRGLGTFPAWWGSPDGRSGSEDRVVWVTRNVATDLGLKSRGLDPAEVRGGKPRNRSARVALAKALALGVST